MFVIVCRKLMVRPTCNGCRSVYGPSRFLLRERPMVSPPTRKHCHDRCQRVVPLLIKHYARPIGGCLAT